MSGWPPAKPWPPDDRHRRGLADAAVEQLRAQLASRIQDRSLAVGTRLPTIRRLAADLGLAARDYAAVVSRVGIDPAEAIRIVQAALGRASTP